MRKAERERLVLRWLKREACGSTLARGLGLGLGLRAPRLHQTLMRKEER